MARDPQMSAKAQALLGLPEGFKTWSPYPLNGMNAHDAPTAVPDNEFTYIENFIRIGDGNLRSLWDVGVAPYTAPTGLTIVWYSFFVIGVNYYCAIFLSDGSAVQLSMANYATTQIGPPGTFYTASSGYLPYAKQWGSTYLLICNRNTQNDYWAWDGSLLYGSGGAAPLGVVLTAPGNSYNTLPSVTAFGGSGTGMTLVAQVNAGSVTNVMIANPGSGYKPGDIVQVAFSGGGSDTSAQIVAVLNATIAGSVSVASGGFGYSANPTVTISGGAAPGQAQYIAQQATAKAVVVNGVIVAIQLTTPGTGTPTANRCYTATPTITITDPTGFGCVAQVLLVPTTVAAYVVVSQGSGYNISPAPVPTVTVVGGGGAGATGTAVVGGTGDFQGHGITSVTLGAAGSGYTSSPTVEVGGGNNRAASATVTLWPFGVSGSAMETYLARVWIVNPAMQPTQTIPPGNLWQVSAPGSVTNFATSAGGVSGQNTDAFLQTQYTNVRQSSGYLYFFGDGSISVVSNVSTGGTPVSTTFNYQNVDPQVGLLWRDAIQDFGRSTVIANETGVYKISGGAASEVSGKIDQFLNSTSQGGFAVYPSSGGVTPSAATATIFNIKHYLNLVTVRDPDTGAQRNVMVVWNEKDWVVASQSVNFTFISTQKVASRYYAWGTDGMSLYPMFNQASTKITGRLDTKQYGGDKPFVQKKMYNLWLNAADNSANAAGVYGNLTTFVSGIPTPAGYSTSMMTSGVITPVGIVQPNFPSPAPAFGLWGTSLGGLGCVTVSVRFTSAAPDITIGNFVVGYLDWLAFNGAS